MTRALCAAVMLVILCVTAGAQGTLVWRGAAPTGTLYRGAEGVVGYCYPTIRKLQGKLYYHAAECPASAHNHLDIGVPFNGPAINMKSVRPATRFLVKPDGTVVLY